MLNSIVWIILVWIVLYWIILYQMVLVLDSTLLDTTIHTNIFTDDCNILDGDALSKWSFYYQIITHIFTIIWIVIHYPNLSSTWWWPQFLLGCSMVQMSSTWWCPPWPFAVYHGTEHPGSIVSMVPTMSEMVQMFHGTDCLYHLGHGGHHRNDGSRVFCSMVQSGLFHGTDTLDPSSGSSSVLPYIQMDLNPFLWLNFSSND